MQMQLGEVDSTGVLITSDQSDIREGRTIVLEKRKVLIKGPLSFADLKSPGGVPGGLVSVDVRCEGGVATIRWTLRTQHEDPPKKGGGGGGGDKKQKDVFELDGSVSQEPITSHPKYAKLLAKYASGEADGEPIWYEKDPDNASQSMGLSSSGGSVTNVSPLFGVKDFQMANAVYRRTKYYKSREEVPQDLVSKIGKIDEPKDLIEGSPKGRFLRIGGEMRQMGDAYQVTEQWMASMSDKPEGLWKSELYG